MNYSTYAQSGLVKDSLITKYSLDKSILDLAQADSAGCRTSFHGIDSQLLKYHIPIAEFMLLVGKPNSMTNEYGETTNIKDTIICTYRLFRDCNVNSKKKYHAWDLVALFIKDNLQNITEIIID